MLQLAGVALLALGATRPAPTLPADVAALTRSIYALSPTPRLVAYLTGGGAHVSPWLLAVPGASSCVLDMGVPYSRAAIDELIGPSSDSYCSADAAASLANAAYSRARRLSDADGAPCIGLGCSAALRAEPERRGSHRCFIAVRTAAGIHALSLTLAKGARDRALEDAVVSRAALHGLAHACGATPGAGVDDAEARLFWQLLPAEAEADGATTDEVRTYHVITI